MEYIHILYFDYLLFIINAHKAYIKYQNKMELFYQKEPDYNIITKVIS
jgi:hypothetical protein